MWDETASGRRIQASVDGMVADRSRTLRRHQTQDAVLGMTPRVAQGFDMGPAFLLAGNAVKEGRVNIGKHHAAAEKKGGEEGRAEPNHQRSEHGHKCNTASALDAHPNGEVRYRDSKWVTGVRRYLSVYSLYIRRQGNISAHTYIKMGQ